MVGASADPKEVVKAEVPMPPTIARTKWKMPVALGNFSVGTSCKHRAKRGVMKKTSAQPKRKTGKADVPNIDIGIEKGGGKAGDGKDEKTNAEHQGVAVFC